MDSSADNQADDKVIVDEDIVERHNHFAKYNTEMPAPHYTLEEYNAHMQDDEWSKEETDYLLNIVQDFYQRWAVIADRYDFRAKKAQATNDIANVTGNMSRSMEDLKARYYQVWAKSMEIHTAGGIANMNAAEFQQHEILTKYDANQEKRRKQLAAGLLNRDPELIKEENLLLAELQRINMQHSRLESERRDIRARLAAPQSTTPTSSLQSSAALNTIYQNLFQAERTRKRGRLSVTTGGDPLISPVSHGIHPSSAPGSAATGADGSHAHRESISGNTSAGGYRKHSGVPGSALASAAPIRSLSPQSEARYGISTPPDHRLTSGVVFRSDRIAKIRQAKSVAQTQKLAAALSALRVPDLVILPTTRVCETFEHLVSRVTILNDMRRIVEKLEGEVRVAEALGKVAQSGSKMANRVDDDGSKVAVDSEISSALKDTNASVTSNDINDQIDKVAEERLHDSHRPEFLHKVKDTDKREMERSGEETSDSILTMTPVMQATDVNTALGSVAPDVAITTVGSPRPGSRSSGRGHKRSASVLSTTSSNIGGKRTKR